MDQTTNSSGNVWYVIVAIVIIVGAIWYFSGAKAPSVDTQPTAETTGATDISDELGQIPGDSTALDAAAAASAADVSGF